MAKPTIVIRWKKGPMTSLTNLTHNSKLSVHLQFNQFLFVFFESFEGEKKMQQHFKSKLCALTRYGYKKTARDIVIV